MDNLLLELITNFMDKVWKSQWVANPNYLIFFVMISFLLSYVMKTIYYIILTIIEGVMIERRKWKWVKLWNLSHGEINDNI